VELRGGVAIVTGAGGGIGSEVARRLGAEGMTLVLADRDAELLAATESTLGADVVSTSIVGDVGEPEHHRELVQAADDLGGLALSVLNAGVYLPGLSWEVPLEQWELQVRVNLWGVVHGVRAAVPSMAGRGRGHVVAMASGAGLVATPTLEP
jgi:NADP-dependent 3-hydroxy acid dehydrogenase YdfG